MRLEQLQYVIRVAELQSFNKASNSLFITSQALNRSIAALEKELDVTIFERFSTGVLLTNEGSQIVEMAKRILADYEDTMDKLHRQGGVGETHKIYLYIQDTYADSYFNDIVMDFNKKSYGIKVIINQYNVYTAKRLAENLHTKQDNNWMLFANRACNEKYLATALKEMAKEAVFIPSVLDGSCIVCVSKDNLLAKQKEISLKTLAQCPLVRFSSGSVDEAYNVEAYLQDYNVGDSIHVVNSLTSMINAIAENIGVGLLLDVASRDSAKTRDLFSKVKILSIKEDTRFQSCFVLPPNYSAEVKTFVDFALGELKARV